MHPGRVVARALKVALVLLLALSPSTVQARPDDLQARLEALLEAPAWQGARVGVLAVRVADGRVLLERDADLRLVPASTLKVVTAAGALRILGPGHRFVTRLLAEGRREGSTLEGDLVLQGGGDPTLSTADLDLLASGARAQGLGRVRGRLVADPGVLSGPPFGPGWAWDDVPAGFSAEVAGLTVDRGRLDLRVVPGAVGEPPRIEGPPALACLDLEVRARTVAAGQPSTWEFLRLPGRPGTTLVGDVPADEKPVPTEVSVPDPALCAGLLARAALERRGIQVQGAVVVGEGHGAVLAEHQSRPLAEILAEGLARSDNLVLECVYRAAPGGTASLGLPEGSCRLVDGSGLSRYDLITPRALAHVLTTNPDLAALLPRSGEGTLQGRLGDGPAAGRVRAKTGSMGGISSLVGYLDPDLPGGTVAFAILSNGFVAPGSEVKALEDLLVQALAAEPGFGNQAGGVQARIGESGAPRWP